MLRQTATRALDSSGKEGKDKETGGGQQDGDVAITSRWLSHRSSARMDWDAETFSPFFTRSAASHEPSHSMHIIFEK